MTTKTLRFVGLLATGFALSLAVRGDARPDCDASPPSDLPDAAKKELKRLEGKWRVDKVVHFDRETTPGEPDDPLVFEFKDNTIHFDETSSAPVVGLDPSTDPKCLDFRPREGFGVLRKDVAIESIYKRDGDTLTWAIYTGRGKSRPASFETPADDKTIVVVLSRVKS